jgi:PAS domain S-box-containing protein
MQEPIRKSGLTIIGDMPWGSHFCQFYRTKKDLVDILVPHFQAGLENNEFCMWVTPDDLTRENARKTMTKALPAFAEYEKKGQIEIITCAEWYLKDGQFDSKRVLNSLVRKLNWSLKKGYQGLRLADNTFWLEKKHRHDFAGYEEAVNNIIGKHKIIAICAYPLAKYTAAEIIDVINNHGFAIVKHEGKWGIVENSSCDNTKEALVESEKRFRQAFHSSPVALSISSIDDGTFVDVNQSFLQLFGYQRFELIGKSAAGLNLYQDPAVRAEIVRQLEQAGKIVNLEVSARAKNGIKIKV